MTDEIEPIERPRALPKVTVTVRLTPDEFERLRSIATKRGDRHQKVLHGWIERGIRDAERAR